MRQRLRPADVLEVAESHRVTKNTIAAPARMTEPITDCVGYAKKLLTTMPAATAKNTAVVQGWPGACAMSADADGAAGRRRTITSAPAVNPKNNQSAKTTYDNS